jgi:soluble lytic murein transglycosylase-like protein
MAGLPTYDPGGTQLTDRQQANPVSGDMFGAQVGRAAQGAGQAMQQLGGKLMDLEAQQKERDDTAATANAYTQATGKMRNALWGEGGIYSRTGQNAEGMTDLTLSTAEQVRNDTLKNLTDPKQRQAFSQMWGRYSESTANSAAGKEFEQRQATRTAAKTSALANLTEEVIQNYNDDEMLATNFDAARAIIRANPDGLPAEMVTQIERESISSLHMSVVQRLATDSPGRAMEYYERNKGQVSGVDHTTVQKFISGVTQARDAKSSVDEIAGGGRAGELVRSVIGAESSGDPDAVSPVGAAGLMQLMPDTARETALTLPGMDKINTMSDDELSAFWKTPEGQKANVRLGTTYLNKQLATFNGDVEAALIGYNAGAANAKKWLDAGRDYSVLPKQEETEPYVRKVLGAYLKVDLSTAQGSKDIQAAISGNGSGPTYKGDARAFLATKLHAGKPASYIDDMAPAMQNRLASMMSEAPDFVQEGLDVLSGARSEAKQAELWQAELARQGGNAAAARKNVAPPGRSRHNHGDAADLGWKGARFANAPQPVKDWVHANAERYGLRFPMGHEPWHIETNEARGGKAAKGNRVTAADAASAKATQRVAIAAQSEGLRVEMAPTAGNPGDIYAKLSAPFSLSPDSSNLDDWLQTARERHADNPSMLAEVERQLTDESRMRENKSKESTAAATLEVFRGLMAGKNVADFDPLMLEKIGPEGVSKMLTLEGKLKPGGDDKTDDATYYKLSQMSDTDFASYDLMTVADKLSGADMRSLADRQREMKRGNNAGKRTTDQTRTQVISSAENILGLKPSQNPEDASTMATLNRALDTKIAAFIEGNGGKEPGGVEMQKMVDDLLIEGHVTDRYIGGILTSKRQLRAFEATGEDRDNFTAAVDLDDIPDDARPMVATTFNKIWKQAPNEEAAVDFYNDMQRVQLGGAPTPPPALDARIRQGLTRTLGSVPTQDQVDAFYREWIIRAQTGK